MNTKRNGQKDNTIVSQIRMTRENAAFADGNRDSLRLWHRQADNPHLYDQWLPRFLANVQANIDESFLFTRNMVGEDDLNQLSVRVNHVKLVPWQLWSRLLDYRPLF